MTEIKNDKPSPLGQLARNLTVGALTGTALSLGACDGKPTSDDASYLVDLSRRLSEIAQTTTLEADIPDGSGGFQGRNVTAQTVELLLSTSPEQYSFSKRSHTWSEVKKCEIETEDGTVIVKAHKMDDREDYLDCTFLLEGPESSTSLVKNSSEFAIAAFELVDANWSNYTRDITNRGDSITSNWLPELIDDLNHGAELNSQLVSPNTDDDKMRISLDYDGFQVELRRYDAGNVFDQETHEFRIEVSYTNQADIRVYLEYYDGELAREAYEAVSKKLSDQHE